MLIAYPLMGNFEARGAWLRKDRQHFSRQRIRRKAGRAQGMDSAGAHACRTMENACRIMRPAEACIACAQRQDAGQHAH
jgi:hypothetical protein